MIHPAVHPVILVGAGPGDPGLITVRGREALARAEVVIADRLVPRRLLDDLPATVELHLRGERRSSLDQDEINRLLIDKARQGLRVVRLKGGDPFVFGRGGEEGEALHAAGVPFEVVPGVTAAIAAPAYAGIPVTHRHVAGAVAFITGHEADDKEGGLVDWEALARGAATLVLYMSVTRLPSVTRRLLAAGRPPSTPAAVIERDTTPAQRTVVGTLADIAELAQAAGITPPALTIVGEVVGLRSALGWFEQRPLRGARLLALSASGDGDDAELSPGMAEAEETLGSRGVELVWGHPLRITLHPERLVEAVRSLHRYRTIAFTSHRAVLAFRMALDQAGLDGRALAGLRIAALDGNTATTLRSAVVLRPDVTASGGGRGLAEALLSTGANAGPVLFPRAAEGRDELPAALEAAGVKVDMVPVYETNLDAAEVQRIVDAARREPFAAVAFASPRAVAALVEGGFQPEGTLVGAIGRTTARAVEEHHLRLDVVASRPSFAALLLALAEALARGRRSE